jgi:hypothetical protein
VVLFNYVLQITSPLFGSSVTYLIPIVATIAGFLDGEVISVWHYRYGYYLIGVYLINKSNLSFRQEQSTCDKHQKLWSFFFKNLTQMIQANVNSKHLRLKKNQASHFSTATV